jgi:predicted nucleic acid-binding protein
MSEPRRREPTNGADIRYIESSALLAAILERDAGAIAAIRKPGRRVTSALTIVESSRAILRAAAAKRLDAKQVQAAARAIRTFAARCDVVAITHDVLTRAGRPFPVEPVRTLDAIHLATTELLGEPPALLTIVTRDVRIQENATALGYVTE